MNIKANIKPTAAEEALVARLKQLDTPAAREAAALVGQTGLPTRRVESWHYTDLRTLLKDVPDAAKPAAIEGDHHKIVERYRMAFVNGHSAAPDNDTLPDGVSLSSAEPVSARKVDDAVLAFGALATNGNSAFTIEGNALAEKPLGLAHVATTSGFSATRHAVTVKAGAEARIIDRNLSEVGLSPLNANVTDLVLEKGAKAQWLIIQQESADATRLARLNVTLHEDADLTLFILNAGGKLVRQEVMVDVEGENANITIKGVNLVGEGAHIDVTTALSHNVPNTTAEETFRNVVTGRGKGVFQGRINVAQIAQKTDAQMACNTLLLSDDSDFSAKPELEIFADDVVCAHGATIADIEDDHLFYLMARGIARKDAEALLVKAFVDEMVEDLGDPELEDGLRAIIDTWLDENT